MKLQYRFIGRVPNYSVLTDPSVYKEEKHAVVDRIFPEKKLQNFMKILCDYSDVEYLEEIVEEYKMYANEHQSIVNATLRYVTAPDDNQLEGIKSGDCKSHAKLLRRCPL